MLENVWSIHPFYNSDYFKFQFVVTLHYFKIKKKKNILVNLSLKKENMLVKCYLLAIKGQITINIREKKCISLSLRGYYEFTRVSVKLFKI